MKLKGNSHGLFSHSLYYAQASQVTQWVLNLPAIQEMWV